MSTETFVSQIRTDLQKTRYMAHMETLPLSELKPGQSAAVVKIAGNGPVRRRYLEMGFVKGEIVKVERVAPLGDPVEYQLKGYRLSLRRADASQILVQPID
ncbi:MAG TPA: FeoA family protein [candidate division Zixibacteria bacterium]|nr:FeoA family protein [candidate division Zixibacteria bacterium]